MGINDTLSPTKSICYCQINVIINNKSISHIFHAVPNSSPIKQNGILGNDFLQSANSIINYKDNILEIANELVPLRTTTRLLNESDHNSNSSTNNDNTNTLVKTTNDMPSNEYTNIVNEIPESNRGSMATQLNDPNFCDMPENIISSRIDQTLNSNIQILKLRTELYQ